MNSMNNLITELEYKSCLYYIIINVFSLIVNISNIS